MRTRQFNKSFSGSSGPLCRRALQLILTLHHVDSLISRNLIALTIIQQIDFFGLPIPRTSLRVLGEFVPDFSVVTINRFLLLTGVYKKFTALIFEPGERKGESFI